MNGSTTSGAAALVTPDHGLATTSSPSVSQRKAGLAQALTGRPNHWSIQLLRYTFVGGVAFVVDFGLLVLFKEAVLPSVIRLLALEGSAFAHYDYLVAATLSFFGGLATNYALSITWVFEARQVKSRLAEFALFAGIGIVGLLLNAGIMALCTEVADVYYMASKLVSTVVVFLFNFVARKATLFTSR
jgi:putative flippase GtrA